jgi:hypothetical protein
MGEKSAELNDAKKKLNELRQETTEIEQQISKLIPKVVSERVATEIEHIEIDQLQNPRGMNRTMIRSFLTFSKDAENIDLADIPIALSGSGPWVIEEFEEFLVDKNFDCVPIEDQASYLVIGERDIDEDEIHRFITNSIENSVIPRIYTQELFICFLALEDDPLEVWSEESLMAAVEGHKGMDFVFSYEEIVWPSFSLEESTDDFSVFEIDADEWNQESPLRQLGYTAREGALSQNQRRQKLTEAYTASIDRYIESDDEQTRWGQPKSAQRLYAIASFISWLCDFQGRTRPNALEKWQSDLRWLKQTYYHNRMKFKWPITLD